MSSHTTKVLRLHRYLIENNFASIHCRLVRQLATYDSERTYSPMNTGASGARSTVASTHGHDSESARASIYTTIQSESLMTIMIERLTQPRMFVCMQSTIHKFQDFLTSGPRGRYRTEDCGRLCGQRVSI